MVPRTLTRGFSSRSWHSANTTRRHLMMPDPPMHLPGLPTRRKFCYKCHRPATTTCIGYSRRAFLTDSAPCLADNKRASCCLPQGAMQFQLFSLPIQTAIVSSFSCHHGFLTILLVRHFSVILPARRHSLPATAYTRMTLYTIRAFSLL